MHRAAAALVAIICWAGLAVQFSVTYPGQQDVLATAWVLARYFTVLTNLLVAVTMTSVAVGGRASPLILGGVTLAILLVGAVYAVLLQGLQRLTGSALLADMLLHYVSPVAMALWWLLFAPRSRLGRSAPLVWPAYPLVYLAYALARGQADQRYPYPFLDVGRIGWLQTAINAAGIALLFICAGYVLVWIDSWRPLGSGRHS